MITTVVDGCCVHRLRCYEHRFFAVSLVYGVRSLSFTFFLCMVSTRTLMIADLLFMRIYISLRQYDHQLITTNTVEKHFTHT